MSIGGAGGSGKGSGGGPKVECPPARFACARSEMGSDIGIYIGLRDSRQGYCIGFDDIAVFLFSPSRLL